MGTASFRDRMSTLGMSFEALARRSRIPISLVRSSIDDPTSATAECRARIGHCLGLRGDGGRLVPTRTFRKQAARRKARTVVSMVQGTMGLESQGLNHDAKDRLFRKSYRRILKSPEKLW